MERTRTPGTQNFFSIDGALNLQIQVYLDGVPQNNPIENLSELGHIPVQQIDRVEIIKGAASAAWGSALGGVINVITKNPFADRPVSGSATATMGERLTTDTHGELTGTVNRFGYYLSGTYLHSDGLLPHNAVNFANGYLKLSYSFANDAVLTAGADYRQTRSGIEEVPPPVDFRDSSASRYQHFFLDFNAPLGKELTLDLYANNARQNLETRWGMMSSPNPFADFQTWIVRTKSGARVTWGGRDLNFTSGFEYEHVDEEEIEPINQSGLIVNKKYDAFGFYSNGTLTVGRLTLLPGARFDHTGINGDLPSYTVGATFQLLGETVLRSYWARGYSLPKAVFNHGPQKVWTVQAGVETSDIPYLWLKGTFFYNNTWHIEDPNGEADLTNQVNQGYELEARTVPFYEVSLGLGYTYTDIRDSRTGSLIPSVPHDLVKLSVHYDNKQLGLKGVLTGSLIKRNSITDQDGRDKDFVWDLTLTKKLSSGENAPELFFSGHNLLDNAQYLSSYYKNAGRWFEGGVRCKF